MLHAHSIQKFRGCAGRLDLNEQIDLANLNMDITFDELEDACIDLREAIEKLEGSFKELKHALV